MKTPAAEIEREIRGYLDDVMGISGIGSEEDLFDVGGLGSLQAVDLLAFLEERYGIAIPPARVTRAGLSTLGQLVALVSELDPAT